MELMHKIFIGSFNILSVYQTDAHLVYLVLVSSEYESILIMGEVH